PLGVACLGLVIAPLALLARERAARRDPGLWLLTTLVLALLAALASIAIGRSGLPLRGAKSSRYAEIAMLLVPPSPSARHPPLPGRRRARALALAALWLTACVGSLDDWDLDRAYLDVAARKRVGIRCLEDYLRRVELEGRSPREGPRCPTLYPRPLEGR